MRSEVVDQAADARYVLDQVLDRASEFGIDPDEVGAAGMSLGGMTVYGLISHPCCKDGRVSAAIVMAGVHDAFPSGTYHHQDVPVLLLHGDADVGFHNSRSAYAQLAPPKWFITLHGEGHSPPFEVPRGPASEIVDTTTVLFWNLTLKGDTAAASADRRRGEGDEREGDAAARNLTGRAQEAVSSRPRARARTSGPCRWR